MIIRQSAISKINNNRNCEEWKNHKKCESCIHNEDFYCDKTGVRVDDDDDACKLWNGEEIYCFVFKKSLEYGITMYCKGNGTYKMFNDIIEDFDFDTFERSTAIFVKGTSMDTATKKATDVYFNHYGFNEDYMAYLETKGVKVEL